MAKKQTPLTLEVLIDYNRELFVPELKEFFAGKKEFEDFRDKSLSNDDTVIKKLDAILQENTMRDLQDKKQKKLWAIIIKSLKEHDILSAKELAEITKLEFF